MDEEPVKLGVPFRSLGDQLEEQMFGADLYKDLPRGRKVRGWKKEFFASLAQAAKDIGEISEDEISAVVRASRKRKRRTEVTVAAEA